MFVYGTLRKGASNAFRMEGAEFVREGVVKGRLYKIDWYPGLILDPHAGLVCGEIWKVCEQKLRELDEFEGLANGDSSSGEYRRVRTKVERRWGGEELESWVWEWNRSPGLKRPIPSGDWLDQGSAVDWGTYKTMGCLGVAGIPIGSIYLFGIAERVIPISMPPSIPTLLFCLALVLTGILGRFCASQSERQAEPAGITQFLLYSVSYLSAIIGGVGLMCLILERVP